jgi:hypothetical protein
MAQVQPWTVFGVVRPVYGKGVMGILYIADEAAKGSEIRLIVASSRRWLACGRPRLQALDRGYNLR